MAHTLQGPVTAGNRRAASGRPPAASRRPCSERNAFLMLGSFPTVRMLAVYGHAQRAMQLLFVEEVGGLWELKDQADRLGRGAVQMRDGEEFGPRRRIVQTAKRCFQFFGW